MGKYDAMRQLLHDAYMLKAIEDLAKIPPDEEIDKIHQFSPEFKQHMADMMNECFGCRNKAELAAARKRHIEIVKKFATAAAVSMAFTFSCAMSVEAIRESFVKFVVRIYDDHLKVLLPSNTDRGDSPQLLQFIEVYYKPVWIPDGYAEEERIKSTKSFSIQYQCENKNIIYKQRPLGRSKNIIIDFNNQNGETFEIDGYGTYVYANNTHQLLWTDQFYCYWISCDSSKEDLLRMSKSLRTDNTMPVPVNDQDRIETYCVPHWLSENFILRESEKMPGYNFRRYTNGNQEYTFLQCKSVDYMVSALANYDLSKYALEQIPDVGRWQYAPGRPSLLSWKDDTYFYLLTGNLSQEDLVELAKSVKPE